MMRSSSRQQQQQLQTWGHCHRRQLQQQQLVGLSHGAWVLLAWLRQLDSMHMPACHQQQSQQPQQQQQQLVVGLLFQMLPAYLLESGLALLPYNQRQQQQQQREGLAAATHPGSSHLLKI
jgi:hypothetical protein